MTVTPSVSMDEDLVEAIDENYFGAGYSSRSDFIRDAVREKLDGRSE